MEAFTLLLAAMVGLFQGALPPAVGNGDLFVVPLPPDAEWVREAEFLGQRYPLIEIPGRGRPFFLMAADLDTEPGSYPLVFRSGSGGAEERAVTVAVRPREYPVERLTLPKDMVTPPPEVRERVARERERAAAVYANSQERALWEPPFSRPADGEPSGNFGKRRILNDLPRSPHSGEDYRSPGGAPVRAAAQGVVRMADELYFSGLTILIDHGSGLVTQYFHLSAIDVQEGQTVRRGETIGKVGATGRVTGPHLHFGIRLFGARADPSQLFTLFP